MFAGSAGDTANEKDAKIAFPNVIDVSEREEKVIN